MAQERPTRREADCNTGDRPFRPKVGAMASASPRAIAGWGHVSLRLAAPARDALMLRCPDAGNRVPQPLTGTWDQGLGCRRQQILVVPAASATLSVTHVREKLSGPLGTVGRKSSPQSRINLGLRAWGWQLLYPRDFKHWLQEREASARVYPLCSSFPNICESYWSKLNRGRNDQETRSQKLASISSPATGPSTRSHNLWVCQWIN